LTAGRFQYLVTNFRTILKTQADSETRKCKQLVATT